MNQDPDATSGPASAIFAKALDLGFDAAGIAQPDAVLSAGDRLALLLEQGWQGDMDWLAAKLPWRRSPKALWPDVRSIIMLGQNYGPGQGVGEDVLANLAHPERGNISVYARGRDYHDVVKGRLKALGQWLNHHLGAGVKVFVDTAPVMEKPLAQAAGLGWQGKHTNLVSRDFGSWLFLGAIYTTLDLPPSAPEVDHCGSCRACLTACPTGALPAPYQLEAQRCISYLTIEHKGAIPREFRAAIGNRIYGCDDCLAVCPWNKYAAAARETRLAARAELSAGLLRDYAALDDAGFRRLFSGTAVKRLGLQRFRRNLAIAMGNAVRSKPELATQLVPILKSMAADDPAPMVRAMAIWALGEAMTATAEGSAYQAFCRRLRASETDALVLAEFSSS